MPVNATQPAVPADPPGGLPEWVKSQLAARGQCGRCPAQAVAEVTFANTGRTELVCRGCWEKQEQADQAGA